MNLRGSVLILSLMVISLNEVKPFTTTTDIRQSKKKTTTQQASTYSHHNVVTSRRYRDAQDPMHRLPPSFTERMRNLVNRNNKESSTSIRSRKNSLRPANVQVVYTLKEFKKAVIDENKHKVVVVRFYATWCKACQAVAPAFYKFAKQNENSITFVEVPLTDDNAVLHAGLEIPSLPYGQIYLDGVLVDSKRMLRKHFSMFQRLVKTYVNGESSLPEDGDVSNPYTGFEEMNEESSSSTGTSLVVTAA